MEARERDQIDRHLSKVTVELTREAESRCNARHDLRDEIVEVSV
jgi:hypothetical protein